MKPSIPAANRSGGGVNGVVQAVDAVTREAMVFAAVGMLIGGLDDLLVDLMFIVRRLSGGHSRRVRLDALPAPATRGRIAVFVPAWDEAGVIGHMLRNALDRFEHDDYRLYIGLYPNDPATIAAVRAVADEDARVVPVIGGQAGPTTKADCLNALWRRLQQADVAEGVRTRLIVLHDAEDVVHPAELVVFDSMVERYDVVQLPVLPLVRRGARLVSGHYADEFSEAHQKSLVVRTTLGAGMPLAGTGCAIATDILARIAAMRGGDPFDADSLVEDYELGLRIAALGGRGVFARVADRAGETVAARAFFPADVHAAVRQKARWMTGIALAGWDRIGWANAGAIGDHWMRMRDRRAPIAVLLLAAAYLALVGWPLAVTLHWWTATPQPGLSRAMELLLGVNLALLCWRLLVRGLFTGRVYGWREALWSAPRLIVGNYIALLAARRALWSYARMLRGGAPVWDKTRHEFPTAADVAAR